MVSEVLTLHAQNSRAADGGIADLLVLARTLPRHPLGVGRCGVAYKSLTYDLLVVEFGLVTIFVPGCEIGTASHEDGVPREIRAVCIVKPRGE